MRILVTGGRDFADRDMVAKALGAVHRKHHITCLIHGGARGADSLCAEWATDAGIAVSMFRANWDGYGKIAGAVRNQQMIDEGKPQACVAFTGGLGTADMVRRIQAAGIPLWDTSGL